MSRAAMLLALILSLLLIGCSHSAANTSAESQSVAEIREEITRRLERHAQALSRGDVEAALQLYASDAIVRPANMDPVGGEAGLREFFTRWFAAMAIKEVAYTTEELRVHGDMAYQIGTYRGTLEMPGQRSVVDRGSFMIVWQHQPGGSWKYKRGIFNSSLPAAQRE